LPTPSERVPPLQTTLHNPTPQRQRALPFCAPGRCHGHRGRHAWSRRHRHPLVPSPRHPPRRHSNVQFHGMPRPQAYHARRPDRANLTRSSRPECPEHAWRSNTHACTPALLHTQTCMAWHPEADATVTQHPRAHT
jgi:hypothetical protein